MIVESYVHRLSIKKGVWLTDWENKCLNDKKLCIKHIKTKLEKLSNEDVYECHNKSYPVREKTKKCITLNFDERVSFNTFTGLPLDIICGLVYLSKKHKKLKVILEKMDVNDKTPYNFFTLHHIPSFGYTLRKNFVTWYKKELYIMNNTKELFLDVIHNNKKYGYTHITLYVILYLEKSLHANILLYSFETNELERFDPFGSGYDKKLDEKLQEYFKELIPNIKYISPTDYMTSMGIQKIDVTENYNEYIGDPNGYCASWSIWYVDMRMNYPNISRNKLILYIAQQINVKHMKFRSVIRNYSKNITDIRDKIFKKHNIDINHYRNDDYDTNTINSVINELNKLID
jgi:hypothetical protein